MAGQNQWSKVKRLKGVLGQQRGNLFRHLAKEITVGCKIDGGKPASHLRRFFPARVIHPGNVCGEKAGVQAAHTTFDFSAELCPTISG
jgi:hypothetical protein